MSQPLGAGLHAGAGADASRTCPTARSTSCSASPAVCCATRAIFRPLSAGCSCPTSSRPSAGTPSARCCPLRLVVAPTQPAADQEHPPPPPVWQPRYLPLALRLAAPGGEPGRLAAAWQGLDDFDLILRLFDFSAWRPILGQRFASQYGPPPFDPVSLGLAWLLARWHGWSWPQLVTELHSARARPGLRPAPGLPPGRPAQPLDPAHGASTTPHRLGRAVRRQPGPQPAGLRPAARATPPSRMTRPNVASAWRSTANSMAARSHMRCRQMNAACFRPPAERQCAARADGKEGCACDTAACQDQCRLATPRDPEAAYVYYRGSNQPHAAVRHRPSHPASRATSQPDRGKHHFGYKSKAFNVLDDRLFTYWPLAGPYAAANRNDHLQTIPGFQDLRRRFPDLQDWRSARPMPARATTTSCATSTPTCTPYAWSTNARPRR